MIPPLDDLHHSTLGNEVITQWLFKSKVPLFLFSPPLSGYAPSLSLQAVNLAILNVNCGKS